MKLIQKIGLFISSFVPLFILIILKEFVEILNGNLSFNFLNSFIIIFLILLVFYGIFSCFKTKKEIEESESKIIKITFKQNVTDQHFLGYFSLFVLFAVTFEIEMYCMACVFFVVLFFIGVVYIKNDMYYVNPLINLLGYSFYDVEFVNEHQKTEKVRAFFKGRLEVGKQFHIKNKYGNFIFLMDKNDDI